MNMKKITENYSFAPPRFLMVLIMLLLLSISFHSKVYSQDIFIKRKIAIIKLVNGQRVKSQIMMVHDSSLQLQNGLTYSFKEIESIRVRGKFAILISTGAGAVVGGIVGLSLPVQEVEPCDPNNPLCIVAEPINELEQLSERMLHGVIGAGIGAVVGAITGVATTKEFPIRSIHFNFVKFRSGISSR
jgi:hypothetical protein